MTYQPAFYAADLSNTVQTTNSRVRLKNPDLAFTFDYLSNEEIVVKVDGVVTELWSLKTSSVITLGYEWNVNDLPSAIVIERVTTSDLPEFNPGSAIRAQDLNKGYANLLHRIEELSYEKK